MTVERQTFAEIMTRFPTGVGIVSTVDGDGAPWGLTSTAISSVAADPPTLLVCVAKTSRTLPALLKRGGFLVNFIADDHAEICRLFASGVPSSEKFRDVAWEPTAAGHPHLRDATVAFADCETISEIDVATHIILIGRVIDGRVTSDRGPIAYYKREFLAWSTAQPPSIQHSAG